MDRKINADTRQIIILAAVVLLLRIVFIDAYRTLQELFGLDFAKFLMQIIGNYPVFIVSLVLNIAFVVKLNKHIPYGKAPLRRLLMESGYILVITVIVAVVVNLSKLTAGSITGGEIIFSLLASLFINSAIVVVTDVAFYYRQTRLNLISESNKKRKAQYQYSQLKQQLNPHFLFNSLNILDCIVQNGEADRASAFIRKLAGTYRYLLSKESEPTVTLEQEMDFVRMYCDLLKERFANGLIVDCHIDAQLNSRHVVPCGVQILVENATKHNIVGVDKPLTIVITASQNTITVSNNLQPKLTCTTSTGVGLSNIAKQYQDIAGKEILIQQNADAFVVTLPLL